MHAHRSPPASFKPAPAARNLGQWCSCRPALLNCSENPALKAFRSVTSPRLLLGSGESIQLSEEIFSATLQEAMRLVIEYDDFSRQGWLPVGIEISLKS